MKSWLRTMSPQWAPDEVRSTHTRRTLPSRTSTFATLRWKPPRGRQGEPGHTTRLAGRTSFPTTISGIWVCPCTHTSSPGVAAKAFQTLGENNINILAISTSPIRLSVVVDGAQAARAVQCLHTAFGLDSDSVFVETQLSAEEIAAKMQKGR